MPRQPRTVIVGVPHHISHRGNNGLNVFLDDSDRLAYLAILRKYSLQYGFEILGYCLMSNHVHLVGIPRSDLSLPRLVASAHRSYAQLFNRRRGRKGHLWQERYFSCPMDDAHFVQALIYVDRNPVRAGIVELPWQYPWSSAEAHQGGRDPAGLVDPVSWDRISQACGWTDLACKEEETSFLKSIRVHTRKGRFLGNVPGTFSSAPTLSTFP